MNQIKGVRGAKGIRARMASEALRSAADRIDLQPSTTPTSASTRGGEVAEDVYPGDSGSFVSGNSGNVGIPVVLVDDDGNVLKTFPTQKQAAITLQIGQPYISQCMAGKIPTALGYRFFYATGGPYPLCPPGVETKRYTGTTDRKKAVVEQSSSRTTAYGAPGSTLYTTKVKMGLFRLMESDDGDKWVYPSTLGATIEREFPGEPLLKTSVGRALETLVRKGDALQRRKAWKNKGRGEGHSSFYKLAPHVYASMKKTYGGVRKSQPSPSSSRSLRPLLLPSKPAPSKKSSGSSHLPMKEVAAEADEELETLGMLRLERVADIYLEPPTYEEEEAGPVDVDEEVASVMASIVDQVECRERMLYTATDELRAHYRKLDEQGNFQMPSPSWAPLGSYEASETEIVLYSLLILVALKGEPEEVHDFVQDAIRFDEELSDESETDEEEVEKDEGDEDEEEAGVGGSRGGGRGFSKLREVWESCKYKGQRRFGLKTAHSMAGRALREALKPLGLLSQKKARSQSSSGSVSRRYGAYSAVAVVMEKLCEGAKECAQRPIFRDCPLPSTLLGQIHAPSVPEIRTYLQVYDLMCYKGHDLFLEKEDERDLPIRAASHSERLFKMYQSALGSGEGKRPPELVYRLRKRAFTSLPRISSLLETHGSTLWDMLCDAAFDPSAAVDARFRPIAQRYYWHITKAGDTPSDVALRLGVPLSQLSRLNKWRYPKLGDRKMTFRAGDRVDFLPDSRPLCILGKAASELFASMQGGKSVMGQEKLDMTSNSSPGSEIGGEQALPANTGLGVVILGDDGQVLREFSSATDAAHVLGLHPSKVIGVLTGSWMQAGGYRFHYNTGGPYPVCPPNIRGRTQEVIQKLEEIEADKLARKAEAARRHFQQAERLVKRKAAEAAAKKKAKEEKRKKPERGAALFDGEDPLLQTRKTRDPFVVRPVVLLADDGSVIKEWESQSKAAASLGSTPYLVGCAVKGINETAEGYRLHFKLESGTYPPCPEGVETITAIADTAVDPLKAVVMLDDEGRVVVEWPTTGDAARALCIDQNQIRLCVRGLTPTASGYRLHHKNENGKYPQCPPGLETKQEIVHPGNRAVVLLDDDGGVIAEWISQAKAAQSLKVNSTLLNRCVHDLMPTANGYRVRFKDEEGGYSKCPAGLVTIKHLPSDSDKGTDEEGVNLETMPVVLLNDEGGVVTEWSSIGDAGRALCMATSTISMCVSGYDFTANGHRVARKNAEGQYPPCPEGVVTKKYGEKRCGHVNRSVVLLDDEGGVVAEWSSLESTQRALGVGLNRINLCVQGTEPTANGYRVHFKTENGEYPKCPPGLETIQHPPIVPVVSSRRLQASLERKFGDAGGAGDSGGISAAKPSHKNFTTKSGRKDALKERGLRSMIETVASTYAEGKFSAEEHARFQEGKFGDGKWTDEEHARFLDGTSRFGHQWAEVAVVVGTRSVVQVRTHAQKLAPRPTPAQPPPRVATTKPGPYGAVVLLDDKGCVLGEWSTQKLCALELGVAQCEVSNCVNGKQPTAKGYRVQRKDGRWHGRGVYPPNDPVVQPSPVVHKAQGDEGGDSDASRPGEPKPERFQRSKEPTKVVVLLDDKGGVVEEWPCHWKAAAALEVSTAMVSMCVSGNILFPNGVTRNGYRLARKNAEGQYPQCPPGLDTKTELPRKVRTEQSIVLLNDGGGVVAAWASMAAAQRDLGINTNYISMCAHGHRPTAQGYRVHFESANGEYPKCPPGLETIQCLPTIPAASSRRSRRQDSSEGSPVAKRAKTESSTEGGGESSEGTCAETTTEAVLVVPPLQQVFPAPVVPAALAASKVAAIAATEADLLTASHALEEVPEIATVTDTAAVGEHMDEDEIVRL